MPARRKKALGASSDSAEKVDAAAVAIGELSEDDRGAAIRPDLGLTEILRALVDESVKARLRHRALLDVLAQSELISLPSYIDAYQRQEEESYGVLLDMLFLKQDEFIERYADWLNKQRETLGYKPRSISVFELVPNETASIEKSPSEKPETRKSRKRKELR